VKIQYGNISWQDTKEYKTKLQERYGTVSVQQGLQLT